MTNARQLGELAVAGIGKNVIINGDMKISQRGTSFVAIASGSYSVDRWRIDENTSAVFTVTQENTGGPNDNFPYWVKFDVTTADASIAAGEICEVFTVLEGYDYASLRGKTCTLSFWVRDTKTGQHYVSLRAGGGGGSYVSGYTISASDTWERKTITFTFAETFGTWNLDNSAGVLISFSLAVGSTFQTTADAWQNGLFAAASDVVNSVDNIANDFGLTGVQLEVGSVATEFELRTISQELALCQRYFEKTYTVAIASWPSANNSYVSWHYLVEKRVTPTITEGAGTNKTGITGSDVVKHTIYRTGAHASIGANSTADAEL